MEQFVLVDHHRIITRGSCGSLPNGNADAGI